MKLFCNISPSDVFISVNYLSENGDFFLLLDVYQQENYLDKWLTMKHNEGLFSNKLYIFKIDAGDSAIFGKF